MENSIAPRDITPGRRDPFRLQFGESEEGDYFRAKRRSRYARRRKPETADRRGLHYESAYPRRGTAPLVYIDPLEDELYNDENLEREWAQEVARYSRRKRRKFVSRFTGRRLRRVYNLRGQGRIRRKFIFPRNVIPINDNEYFEENYNPNDYVERRYRAGYEGGYSYPRLGNYGPYGESGPEFEQGLHSSESASPYASGYQIGESYEGEHGYGSKEDLGGGRKSF